jgi:16S rRNA (cytidine1402-2'-O)-methyltransferase
MTFFMLYFIPTPIGNLDDITVRSLKLFKSLSVFCAEDTRTFKGLMTRYEISHADKVCIPLTSYTAPSQLAKIIEMATIGDVGVVSEAGTPWLSDPAKELIKLCREQSCPFEVLPWANALIPAVVGSPCDTTHFAYHGFLPTKKWRKSLLQDIVDSDYPVFLYESVHRVDKLLEELKELNFAGTVGIFRELSKMYEQKIVGTVDELLAKWGKELVAKGEFVIGIYPKQEKSKEKKNKYEHNNKAE